MEGGSKEPRNQGDGTRRSDGPSPDANQATEGVEGHRVDKGISRSFQMAEATQ